MKYRREHVFEHLAVEVPEEHRRLIPNMLCKDNVSLHACKKIAYQSEADTQSDMRKREELWAAQ